MHAYTIAMQLKAETEYLRSNGQPELCKIQIRNTNPNWKTIDKQLKAKKQHTFVAKAEGLIVGRYKINYPLQEELRNLQQMALTFKT